MISDETGRANGNGRPDDARSEATGFGDDFDDLIRDRDQPYDPDWSDPRVRHHERFGEFGDRAHHAEQSLADLIARVVELLASAAGEALPAATKRQLEHSLRDLLVVARDSLDRMIARIDEHESNADVEIEEIPID